METQTEFDKRRKRGLWILTINEFISGASLYYYKIKGADWIFYSLIIYFVFSTLLWFNRMLNNKPKEESNYLFGETIGNKMNTVPQKFIMEAMLISLVFIIIAGIASSIYSIFFTEISVVYKVIIGLSGLFGAIFMSAILVSTFQQYKSLVSAQEIYNQIELSKAKNEVMKEVYNNPFDTNNVRRFKDGKTKRN